MIAGILAMSLRAEDLVGHTRHRLPAVLVLIACLLGLAAYIVAADSRQAISERIIEPIEWQDASVQRSFFDLDREIRGAQSKKTALCAQRAPSASSGRECYDKLLADKVVKRPITLTDHLGLASWWQRVLSAQAAVLGVVLLISIGVYHWYHDKRPHVQEAIVLSLALFSLWIPLRIYSDWYIAYQSMADLQSYSALGVVGALIVVALVVTSIRTFGGPMPKWPPILLGAASAVIATLGALNPAALGPVGDWFSRVPIPMLAIGELVLLFLLFVLVGPRPQGQGAS
jgi:hypothetical protein